MSIAARDWAWEQDLPPVTKIVLLALAERADDSGACWPSLNAIAKHCRVTRPTVCSHLDKLEEAGLIARDHRHRDDGSQTSTRYQLTLSKSDAPLLSDLTGLLSTENTLLSQVNRPVKTALQRTEPSVTVTEPSPSLPVLSEPPETRAAKPAKVKKQGTPLGEITEELVLAYAGRWTADEVKERIDYALNHAASKKWLNRDIGLRRWLKRDADSEDERRGSRGTSPPQRNGTGPPAQTGMFGSVPIAQLLAPEEDDP